MKKMKLSWIIGLILVLVMVTGFLTMPAAAAENERTLKLHFYRPDGDYEGWSVWFWDPVSEGVDVPFVVENGEMVASFPLKPDVDQVGYIVKKGDWAAKDVNEDQYINVSGMVSEVMHVYVESGVKGYTPEPMRDFSVKNVMEDEEEPKERSELLFALGLILLLAVIVGANILAVAFSQEVFDDGYNFVTGGLWFLAVLVALSLVIQPLREFTSDMLVEVTTFKFMALPESGTVMFWVDLIVCVLAAIFLWLLADANCGFLGKALCMILFGAIHAVAIVLIVGVAIRLLVIAIVCFLGYAFLSGAETDSGSSTSTYTPPKPEPKTEEKVEVWREMENGNMKRLQVNSDGSMYKDPDDGEWHKIKK